MQFTFYLTGHEITLRSNHLPLKKFLRKMTLNDTVNNWSTEIESFNVINFVHISGKNNVLADMLSRLIDIDPDLKQQPKLKDYEFGKYYFETLLRQGGIHTIKELVVRIMTCVKYKPHMTMRRIQNSLLNCPWMMRNFFSLQEQDPKI